MNVALELVFRTHSVNAPAGNVRGGSLLIITIRDVNIDSGIDYKSLLLHVTFMTF